MPPVDWIYSAFGHFQGEYFYFYNYIFPPVFDKIPLNVYLYVLMAGAMLISLYWRSSKSCKMFSIASIALIMVLFFQLHGQQQYWREEMKSTVSPENKFFDFALAQAPEGASCYVMTQTNPRYIRYVLFPHILVTERPQRSSNCVIVLGMFGPRRYVPKSFNRVVWYDQYSLLAFQK